MPPTGREPVLIVRAKGPATEGGRISLQALLILGQHVQSAVERVARVLLGQTHSRRPGPKPPEVARSCALEVVALNRGSFEVAFDVPRDTFDSMHLGLEAVEKLVEGIEVIRTDGQALPPGYDLGVLHSLRDLGQILGRDIETIEAETRTQRVHRTAHFDREVQRRVVERIKTPVPNLRTIEGRLLMADFRHDGEKCRIHPPTGNPVVCQFGEALEDTVYEHLRRRVRVTGEASEDPMTGRITSIRITDIEPLSMEGANLETVSAETFWQEPSLEQIAAEQGVQPIRRLEDVWGKGSDLWVDEEDFQAFLAGTRGE